MGRKVIRIGIVDDHPVYRLGLRRAFEREAGIKVVWDIGTGSELLKTLQASPADVLLIDLNLGPHKDGLELTRAVVARHPAIRVLVISASLDDEAPASARLAGASGYLPKDMSVAETVAAVRGLAEKTTGRVVFGDFLSLRNGAASRGPSHHGFTRRERQVATELRKGRPNRQIAAELGVSIPTVNKHVQQVLRKLQVKSRGEAVARLDAEASGRVSMSTNRSA